MEDFPSLYEKYGIPGIILAVVYSAIKLGVFTWKKTHGTWYSYKDIRRMIVDLENKVNKHLDKEAMEDIMFAELRTDHSNLKKSVEIENQHIFSQLKSLHEKLDTLFQILLEKK